jgi:hydrophobe/amphiphile efflux-1 (HAE1) family protein
MKLPAFFIDRPIFAAVLSVIITLAGAIALFRLPISEYPEVVPPSVLVLTTYPGANPKIIGETVASPLEQAIVGVDDLMYMSSEASMDGTLYLTVTFKIGTDVDRAQVDVQNRVAQALPRLPQEVRDIGVTTQKSSPNLTGVVHLTSPTGRYDALYLRNYATLNVRDTLARIPGMGQLRVVGAGDYAMRVWLDPEKLAARNLTTGDVVDAVREQNVQVAAGEVGAPPGGSASFQLALNVDGRLQEESQFKDIIIKSGRDGEVIKLSDVARVQMGASEYAIRSLLDNKTAIAIPITQQPGSNALELSKNVRKTMDELKKSFPDGMDYEYVYDTTLFVRQSIEAVIHTLLEAIALVVLVVILFLQTWRASIIPLAAVPVSVIGTFAVLLAFGFSINTLSLFGLVLAIGIVVDDAIVIVENVERHIRDGLSPKEATKVAMNEVSRPIVAITLVLCAVFVPVAFVSGLTGEFYRQFALTIAISAVISAFNSLTLSPALAAALLKPHDAHDDWLARGMHSVLGGFFARFNRVFERASGAYSSSVVRILRRSGIALIVYLGLIALTYINLNAVPAGFIPQQDKGFVVSVAQLPPGSSLPRTENVVRDIASAGLATPGFKHAVEMSGMSTSTYTSNSSTGMAWFVLDDFEKRSTTQTSLPGMLGSLNQKVAGISQAFVGVFPAPAIMGMGTLGGFKLNIEDRADLGEKALFTATQQVLAKAWQDPNLAGVFSSYQINAPQLAVNVNRLKAKQQDVRVSDVFQTLQVYLGSLYVNDFNRFGRTYRVVLQADSPFREQKEDILKLKTRNAHGEMVPLSALVKIEPTFGPEIVQHYNGYRSADINGGPAGGVSSGQAQAAISKILDETLPRGFAYEWTDLSYQQHISGNTTTVVFCLCVLLVFLVLAAQYESVTLPLAIILIVPMCLLAAATGLLITHGDSNIFTQVGLVVLVGLACKNAILIVEFARHLEASRGLDPIAAVLEATRIRLRPILMTSIAFIAGVLPLVFSQGPGFEVRRAMGVVVFSGMLGVTFFGLLLTPVFYVLVRKLGSPRQASPVSEPKGRAVPALPLTRATP